MNPQMLHCMQCGEKLEMRYLPSEGKDIPYCTACRDFRFPVFNTAVSIVCYEDGWSSVELMNSTAHLGKSRILEKI